LPTLMVSFVENQSLIAVELDKIQACKSINKNSFSVNDIRLFISNDKNNLDALVDMSFNAFSVVDGLGVSRVHKSIFSNEY